MQFRRDRGRGVQGGRATGVHHNEVLMEQLEGRVLLSGSNFPALADLVNPSNTVVRLETNLGDIYFELYDVAGPNGAPPAPITTNNFLGYVRRGDYDQSFFHRLAFTQAPVEPFVLQGGGFRFLDGTGTVNVPTQAAIQNEFHAGRSNVERSIAMAKLGNNPNSATSQFFINLRDNGGAPAFLDQQNGGFTVFGRVADNASWQVVLAIQGLEVRNFNNLNGALTDVPVTPAYSPATGLREAALVMIRDAEIVKAANVNQYYTMRQYYPEGFAGSTINEFLPMGNPNNQQVHYQVIVRSEVPQGAAQQGFTWFRDRVIDTGVIGANSRGGVTISQFGPGGAPGASDLVPQGVPYAIEIWSTLPLTANISHYDFGTSTGEVFTGETATRWTFAQAEKVQGAVFDFLVWQNTTDVPANIQITFFFQTQQPVVFNTTTAMYRRGGLSLSEMAQIPNSSVFSIEMQSDQPIVAALTHFDRRQQAQGGAVDAMGSASLGHAGLPSIVGALPGANAGSGVADAIAVVNPGNVAAVVNLTLVFNDNGQVLERPAALLVAARSRGTFSLASIQGVSDGRRYTILYRTNTPVFADWTHAQAFPGAPDNRDAVANPVSTVAATTWRFAEGFMDSARAGQDVLETISVYNPNTTFFGVANQNASVTFRFFYGDGFSVTETVQVQAGRRLDLNVHTLQSVLAQASPANNRYFFSVEVTSNVPIVAQMSHYDLTLGNLQPSGGFATLGAPVNPVRLDNLNGTPG